MKFYCHYCDLYLDFGVLHEQDGDYLCPSCEMPIDLEEILEDDI